MSLMEIILLIIGFIAFVVSFIIPDKGDNGDEESLTREEIREIVMEEYEASKGRLESITEETIDYSVEKAERSLEKITNEKMLALGEYSDSILADMNNNHQETVFLHDMLNNNKNDLTVMLSQAMKDSKEALDTSKQAIELSNNALLNANTAFENASNASASAVVAESKMIDARKMINGDMDNYDSDTSDIPKESSTSTQSSKRKTASKTTKSTSKSTKTSSRKTKNANSGDDMLIENDGQISLNFDVDYANSANSNEKILKLHKQGKSNVAIAKELGLGVGEVNLVIALFDKK